MSKTTNIKKERKKYLNSSFKYEKKVKNDKKKVLAL